MKPGIKREQITALRIWRGDTKEQFARLFHVSFSTVCRWESGEHVPQGMAGQKLGRMIREMIKEIGMPV